jgi:methylamine dehydrogenase heavy chain
VRSGSQRDRSPSHRDRHEASSKATRLRRGRVLGWLAVCGAGTILFAASGFAASPSPETGEHPSVATLPPPGAHWLWVPDRLLAHSLLFDGDSGDVLGMVDSPGLLTPQAPLVSTVRGEVYSVDVGYTRGLRGERTDFITIYDLASLAYKDEIVFPTRAATGNTSIAYSAMIGPRFLAVFNQFPATSVSILDLDARRFVGEIGVSGCAGIYPIDDRRFATLCGDGTVGIVEIDDEGHQKSFSHSAKFFDTIEDPVFMAGARNAERWTFVSFEGMVHTIDFSGSEAQILPAWSLLGEDEAGSNWRPGGLQLVALHAPTNRLFVVMHEGGPGSHKDAGPEIWVHDLDSHERLERIEAPGLAAAFLGDQMGLDRESFAATLLGWILPTDTVHSIAVSQDASPLLFVRNAELGAVGVIDPDGGRTLRILGEAGLFGPTLRVP